MKRMFSIFVPVCIVSFILFGISVAILGKKEEPSTSEAESADFNAFIDRESLTDEYSKIQVDCSGAKIEIAKSSDNTTKVEEKNADGVFSVYVRNDTLFIDSSWSFFGWDSSLSFWDNISETIRRSTSGLPLNAPSLRVYVPEKTYETILVSLNAGELNINEISVNYNEIDVNAGELKFNAAPTQAEYLGVTVNAGGATISGISPSEYLLDNNAGNLCVKNLTGHGDIEVSTGSCEVEYDEVNGDVTADVTAGNLNIYLPAGTSATVYAEKSAGEISVVQNGRKKSLHDEETFTFGGGKYSIHADISAGGITISDSRKNNTARTEIASSAVQISDGVYIEPLEEAGSAVGDALSGAGSDIQDALTEAGSAVGGALSDAGSAVGSALSALG